MTSTSSDLGRPGGTAPHVRVADLDHPELRPDDRHHLARVRRLRNGDPLTVTDGAGRWRWCAFDDVLGIVGDVMIDPAPTPRLTVAFALVKGQKPELVVQKLTELGVDEIVPFVAERSVVRWDDERADRNHARLVTVAIEAAQQSRRTWFPTVAPVTTFDRLAARPGAVMCERDGVPLDASHTTVLVGPEGGWSSDELRLGTVGLGATVLRAETAAIAVATLQCALRDGRVR